MIEIVTTTINPQQVLDSVQSDLCGASLLFCGTTRRLTHGRETERLEYECYHEMAIRKLESLCDSARSKWPVENVSIVHRTGVVNVGETSVVVAVSSPHRAAAFEAGQWLLERLKKEVPIWKKEQWTDGTSGWIHPDEPLNSTPGSV